MAGPADYAGTMTESTPLAQGFAPVDRAAWRALVAAALARSRGEVSPDDAERLLATTTDDDYTVSALYTPDDVADLPIPADPGSPDFVRGAAPAAGMDWDIRQRHITVADTPAAVTDDLANGVTSVWLTGGDPDTVAEVLAAVDLADTPVIVEDYEPGARLARTLLASEEPLNPASSLGLDPLGILAATGRAPDVDDTVALAGEAQAAGIKAFTIDGSVYHDAGASFGEELGAVTAAGLATLRLLTDAGMDVATAAGLLEFRIVVTDDQFASIAKLRAARIMWARVLDVAGAGSDTGQLQHATTSIAMLTSRDPWVNLIRNCVAGFAAGVGAAASVTVEPHTFALEPADTFALRMARNTQLLLLQESHVGFVADPAGGSYYVENRTRQLADAGWAVLREIEAAGGMTAALDSGALAARIERTWNRTSERVAARRAPITGVSEFPDRERRDTPAQGWRRPGGGLPQHRVAEAFEVLRDRADVAATEPVIALITLGPLARHAARETFATNLFAAGGISTVSVAFDPDVSLELPDGVAAACVCGTDEDYDQHIEQVASAAGAAGVRRLLVAGKPGARAERDEAAGVVGHIYVGCDALAVLTDTLDLEVPA